MSVYMAAFIVGAIAVVYAGFLFLYQRYMDKKNGVKEKQAQMKECQKKITELTKTKDLKEPKVAEELSTLQKETMSLSMTMMKAQFKGMIWIMIVGLAILYIITLFNHGAFPVGKFIGLTPAIVWFILVSLGVNILYKIIFYVLEKEKVVVN